MATQAELDKEQNRTKSLSGTIGKIDLGGGVYDLNTRPDDNKEGVDERIQNDGIDVITNPLDLVGGGGGGGLGFDEETLDVVDANNVAGQRVFLTKVV